MKRLQGGPFYELSFLLKNQADKKGFVKQVLYDLGQKRNFQIHQTKEALSQRIQAFVAGEEQDDYLARILDIDAQIEISGSRVMRLYIAELSDELWMTNFWFYGSQFDADEWHQTGLQDSDKPEFRVFFEEAKAILNPVVGTIAYEQDCSALFDTEFTYPNVFYRLENLSPEKITQSIQRMANEFEYCWINDAVFSIEKPSQ